MQPETTQVKTWAEMTWQEKREERFNQWLAAPGVKFVSAEAETLHKQRVTWWDNNGVLQAFSKLTRN